MELNGRRWSRTNKGHSLKEKERDGDGDMVEWREDRIHREEQWPLRKQMKLQKEVEKEVQDEEQKIIWGNPTNKLNSL